MQRPESTRSAFPFAAGFATGRGRSSWRSLRRRLAVAFSGAVLLAGSATAAGDEAQARKEVEPRRYTYSWQFVPDGAMAPRGGTTHGPDVTLAGGPSEAWQHLTEPGLTDLERDRRAILAMAGAYRTTFDFIETVGFTPEYEPRPPYQSWATERIYVIADEPEFISLQHILVMTFVQDDGSVSEPVVVKHWRQDWRYEDTDLHVYRGHNRWERRRLSEDTVEGTWSQAVFQVDDSPRYQAIGRWAHRGNHSTWTSNDTWRPLPRREFSVRDDYDVLDGTNRVTITPRGWVHEEDNLKRVLGPRGSPAEKPAFLAREAGLNRYRHIVGYDFSAGDAYWERTAPFWAGVRRQWRELLARFDDLTVRSSVAGESLFSVMFRLAEQSAREGWSTAEARERIRPVLERFVDGGRTAAPD